MGRFEEEQRDENTECRIPFSGDWGHDTLSIVMADVGEE
jgi:hypothetical protein